MVHLYYLNSLSTFRKKGFFLTHLNKGLNFFLKFNDQFSDILIALQYLKKRFKKQFKLKHKYFSLPSFTIDYQKNNFLNCFIQSIKLANPRS